MAQGKRLTSNKIVDAPKGGKKNSRKKQKIKNKKWENEKKEEKAKDHKGGRKKEPQPVIQFSVELKNKTSVLLGC